MQTADFHAKVFKVKYELKRYAGNDCKNVFRAAGLLSVYAYEPDDAADHATQYLRATTGFSHMVNGQMVFVPFTYSLDHTREVSIEAIDDQPYEGEWKHTVNTSLAALPPELAHLVAPAPYPELVPKESAG